MACFRCGVCCFSYTVGIAKDEDIRRWMIYHGLLVRDMDDERMGIMGHSRCEMLEITADGIPACRIYENRPQICSAFLCPRARAEDELKGSD